MKYQTHKNGNFTTIDNSVLKNAELSLKAKGLLILLLTFSEDWNFHATGIATFCKEGRNTVNSIMQELEAQGHLYRERVTKNGKIISWVYHIYETPFIFNQGVEKPHTEKPHTEKRDVENRYNNKDNTNNNNLNNKNTKNILSCDNDIIVSENTKIDKKSYKEMELQTFITESVKILNSVLNTNFRDTTPTTVKDLKKLYNEDYRKEDIMLVVEYKNKEWKNTDWKKYLVPSTLFRFTNFTRYIEEANNQLIKQNQKANDMIEWLREEKEKEL